MLALTGCDQLSDSPELASLPAFESHDSAGIAVVTILSPSSVGTEWRLGSTPILEIGSVDGSPAMQLYQVVGATRLSDGRIVIANRSSSELRFFDSAGMHLQTVGGTGSGPGEFRDLQHLQSIDDSLHIYDGGARRISVFDNSGGFARTIQISTPPTLWQYVGRFASGERVFSGLDSSHGPPAEGLGRDRSLYVLVSPEGEQLGTLASLDGPERIIRYEPDPTGRMRTSFTTVAFTSFPRPVILPGHLVIGAGDRYEMKFVAPGGAVERLIRWNRPMVAVSDSDLQGLAEETADPRQIPHAAHFPAHGPLISDRDGRLWVSDYGGRQEQDMAIWNIFGEDGAWLGTARVPARLTILEIGDSYVLGVWRDPLGVEYVRLYELATEPAA